MARLWEFNRNTDYNANSYFDKPLGHAHAAPGTHYNIFGYNVGGPLYIPHVYNTNKQKTFFFCNEEWRKILSSAGTNVQHTIDPADIPVAGTDLNYKAPAFATRTNLVVPNISTSSEYYKDQLKPLGLTPNTAFPNNNTIPASLFDSDGLLYLNSGILPPVTNPATDQNTTSASNPITVLRYGTAHRPQVQRQVGDPGPLHGRPGDAGLCGAGTGMAVGELQHPHQHPVEPVAVCCHQDQRYDQLRTCCLKPASTTTAT